MADPIYNGPRLRWGAVGLAGERLDETPHGDRRQRVLRIRVDGEPVIVKLYGRRRGRVRDAMRGAGHRWLVGKTGMAPETRRDVERRVLRLWREFRFGCPRVLDIEFLLPLGAPYLIMEEARAVSIKERLRDPAADPQHLVERLRAFGPEWSQRHDLAIRDREPALVHTHPSFEHVLDLGSSFCWIDFEFAYTRPERVEHSVDREIRGMVASLLRDGGVRGPALLDELVASYPCRGRLERALGTGRQNGGAVWQQRLRAASRLTRAHPLETMHRALVRQGSD